MVFRDMELEDDLIDLMPSQRTGCFVQYDNKY
jgi:hypothetical protein